MIIISLEKVNYSLVRLNNCCVFFVPIYFDIMNLLSTNKCADLRNDIHDINGTHTHVRAGMAERQEVSWGSAPLFGTVDKWLLT